MLPLSSKIGPGLISSFLSKRWLRVVLDGTSSQEYPVNAGVPEGSILGLTLFLLYINELPGNVICDIAIYVDDGTRKIPPWSIPPPLLNSPRSNCLPVHCPTPNLTLDLGEIHLGNFPDTVDDTNLF